MEGEVKGVERTVGRMGWGREGGATWLFLPKMGLKTWSMPSPVSWKTITHTHTQRNTITSPDRDG